MPAEQMVWVHYFQFKLQVLKSKLHFTTLHGKVGLVASVMTALSVVLGTASFRKLGIIQRFPEEWQPQIKWLHRIVSCDYRLLATG